MDNSIRLRQVRESLGLNQRDMAAELKVTNGAIALWGVSAIFAELGAKATWVNLAFDIIHNRPTLPKGNY